VKIRILISNDDGIYSPGITALAKVASRFGEVRIVAPDVEQSSMGHAITASRPLRYKRIRLDDFEAYRVNGTPADCVALGTHHWQRIDLVLSGINLGLNLGNSCWHSGTLAAAKQAALLGLRGIAISTAVSDKEEPNFSALEPYIAKVLDLLLEEKTMPLVNVNLPQKPRGIRWTRQSRAALRRQSRGQQGSDGPANLLVYDYAAAGSGRRNGPLGRRAQLGFNHPVASRSHRRERSCPRAGASSHATNRYRNVGQLTKEQNLPVCCKRAQGDQALEQENAE
jgi:5'-nucleotidase